MHHLLLLLSPGDLIAAYEARPLCANRTGATVSRCKLRAGVCANAYRSRGLTKLPCTALRGSENARPARTQAGLLYDDFVGPADVAGADGTVAGAVAVATGADPGAASHTGAGVRAGDDTGGDTIAAAAGAGADTGTAAAVRRSARLSAIVPQPDHSMSNEPHNLKPNKVR